MDLLMFCFVLFFLIYEENTQAAETVTFLSMPEWLMVSWLVDFQARRDLNIVCTGVSTVAGLVEFLPVIPRHEFVFSGAKKKTKPKEKRN